MGGRVLVVGGDGQIGGALAAHLTAAGTDVLVSSRRPGAALRIDLAAPPSRLPEVDAAVLCAAAARLGACDADPAGTRRINVDGPLALARRLRGQGAHVLFLSSDKVFDGQVARRCRHGASCPRTEYGRQKADAEAALLGLGAGIAVLRLSKVLDPALPLLAGWAAGLAAGRPVAAFSDMLLAPVTTERVCALIARLLAARAEGPFQLTGAEDRPYADLARRLAAAFGAEPGLVEARACDPAQHPPAARPPHSTLDMSVEAARFGTPAPAFDIVADEIAAAVAATVR